MMMWKIRNLIRASLGGAHCRFGCSVTNGMTRNLALIGARHANSSSMDDQRPQHAAPGWLLSSRADFIYRSRMSQSSDDLGVRCLPTWREPGGYADAE
jgi:hypothetical protein